MLRGLRFNVASQKLDDTTGDVTGTGIDVNDNEKPYDNPQLETEVGYAAPSTAEDGKSAKKKTGSLKKKSGKKEQDRGEKHNKMVEDLTDSDEDLTGKTARKLATEMSEKGEIISV